MAVMFRWRLFPTDKFLSLDTVLLPLNSLNNKSIFVYAYNFFSKKS